MIGKITLNLLVYTYFSMFFTCGNYFSTFSTIFNDEKGPKKQIQPIIQLFQNKIR